MQSIKRTGESPTQHGLVFQHEIWKESKRNLSGHNLILALGAEFVLYDSNAELCQEKYRYYEKVWDAKRLYPQFETLEA